MAFCVYHWTTLRDTSRSDLLQGGEGWTYTVTNSTRSTSQSEVQWQVLETMGLSAVQSRTTLQDISESDLVCAKGLQDFLKYIPTQQFIECEHNSHRHMRSGYRFIKLM